MAAVPSVPSTWDVFCRVVDNFGDAGVCWRLALMLHREHGLRVRLWIDDLAALRALYPALDASAPLQHAEGVAVHRLEDAAAPAAAEAAVVIEAFGCGLPGPYVAGMAATARPPLWIVLEYLSAESWVDGHHGLASPHPRLSLQRYFFFPGFTKSSGGLLREAGLLARRDAFDAAARRAFWQVAGFADAGALTVSLFAYADAPVAALLAMMVEEASPVTVALPGDTLLPAVRDFFGAATDDRGPWRRGALEVRALPFLAQARYDELLWACDLNFVRGEDSFVRAQWAARPMVWQPYRQDDNAHRVKLEAFLGRYCAGLAPETAAALGGFWRCWSGGDAADIAAAWPALRDGMPVLARHAGEWARKLADCGEMAAQLVEFACDRVE